MATVPDYCQWSTSHPMEPSGSRNKNVKRSDFNLKVSPALFWHNPCHGAKLLVIGDLVALLLRIQIAASAAGLQCCMYSGLLLGFERVPQHSKAMRSLCQT